MAVCLSACYNVTRFFSKTGGNHFHRLNYFSKMTSNKLDQVANVDIDSSGRFKYILIKVYDQPNEENQKIIVRGYASCGYHADIYDSVTPKIYELGLECECLGGGRIRHTPDERKIEVFGYSQGYGKADHAKAVALLKEKFKDYNDITVTNEDY